MEGFEQGATRFGEEPYGNAVYRGAYGGHKMLGESND